METNKKRLFRIIFNIIVILIFLGVSIFIIIKYFPFFKELSNDSEKMNAFIDNIRSYGHISFFIIIGLQIFQTIFMIIPSGPIVMVAGAVLNPFLAVLAAVIGQSIGGTLIFIFVRQFGMKFATLFVDEKKIKENILFRNEKRTKLVLASYLLIPALPKDIVAFICPFTKIKLWEFILINTIFRIPMTIVTVLISHSFITGDYTLVIILSSILLIIGILSLIFQNKILAFLDKNKDKST